MMARKLKKPTVVKTSEDTGIFRDEIISISAHADTHSLEAAKAVFAEFCNRPGLAEHIEKMRSVAEAIRDDAKRPAAARAEAKSLLERLTLEYPPRNPDSAMLAGIKLGENFIRMLVRAGNAERFVRGRKKINDALFSASKDQAHTQEQIEEALQLFDKLHKDHPAWKNRRIEGEVKTQTGIPPRTLQRHRKRSE